MELNEFEKDLGLQGLRGAVMVSANVWDSSRNFHFVKVPTTKAKLHNAIQSVGKKGRFSTERMLSLFEKNDKSALDALAYRAVLSDKADKAIGEKNACHLGVLKC